MLRRGLLTQGALPAATLAFILGSLGRVFATMSLTFVRYGSTGVLTQTVTIGAAIGATVSRG